MTRDRSEMFFRFASDPSLALCAVAHLERRCTKERPPRFPAYHSKFSETHRPQQQQYRGRDDGSPVATEAVVRLPELAWPSSQSSSVVAEKKERAPSLTPPPIPHSG